MRKLQILALSILISATIGLCNSNAYAQAPAAKSATVVNLPSMPQPYYKEVSALDVVNSPIKYLRQNIKIRGKFDKYATLGLDYPPAMRSHEKYISFMIQRPDITDHNIPLSELKIFIKKDLAEKNIDLDAGDEIVFTGKVFSTALGDPWMDAESLTVVKKVKKS